MNPFLYVIVLNPTKKAHEEGEVAKIITPLGVVLAPDEASARTLAAREIPAEYAKMIERVKVHLRAFLGA